MLKRVLALAIMTLSATGANAAVLLSLQGTPTENGGVFTYVYEATLQAGAQLQPSDFFTVFDFIGLVEPVSSSNFVIDPALDSDPTTSFAFAVTSAPLGVTPPSTLVQPVDNPSIPNVTVTLLSGSDNIVPTGNNVLLGTLSLSTPNAVGTTPSLTVGSEFRQVGTGGLETANISATVGPIPEPSTYALMGFGLLAAGAFARWSRNRR
jgi:PEP-CTERM motif